MNIGIIAVGMIFLVVDYLLLRLVRKNREPDHDTDDLWGRLVFYYRARVVVSILALGVGFIILGIVW
jgi:hypothetical protein